MNLEKLFRIWTYGAVMFYVVSALLPLYKTSNPDVTTWIITFLFSLVGIVFWLSPSIYWCIKSLKAESSDNKKEKLR